jgi:hypothetical protein
MVNRPAELLEIVRHDVGNTSGGITFAGALTLLFIGLKLGHVIMWGWLWVFSPLWIPTVLWLCFHGALFLMVLVVGFFRSVRDSAAVAYAGDQEKPREPEEPYAGKTLGL